MFAQKCGLDSSLIVRYEYGRVALRYEHAWRFLRQYLINPFWLANGQGARWSRAASLAPDPDSAGIDKNALFSEVFDRDLVNLKVVDQGVFSPAPTLTPDEMRARAEWWFQNKLEAWMVRLPDKEVARFVSQLEAEGQNLFKTFPEDEAARIAERKVEFERWLNPALRLKLYGSPEKRGAKVNVPIGENVNIASNEQVRLTSDSGVASVASEMLAPVNLQKLVHRVRQQMKKRGIAQNALAKELGVTRQAISLWFTKGGLPSGEVALRLHAWLESRESPK